MTSQTMGTGIVPQWTFADRLRKARHTGHMTQAELAQALGISASRYSQWEMGMNKPRDLIGMARKIAAVTGVSIMWLLEIEEGPTNGPGLPLLPQVDSNDQPFDYRFRLSAAA